MYSETPAAELATEKVAAQKAAGAQLTGAQLAVLSELSATEHRNIHDLAERTAKSPAVLRPHLQRLVKLGLIEASAQATSKNRDYLLTPAGQVALGRG